ncbi:glycosyl hydrolase 115 family protein [Novosphingobium profundi]|uniref:glycosyl hydrolase 115 family protein n=1 Tax=Novosphingobium profundi TaxID=1774954 RepID=UPI001BD9F801|nr:glycosyl hydrolase 115 family protein [Novosphingobium profundi]MBT0670493.1 glycosyl hydrolase 115 family protein [Novosphingobium profundi]
MIVPRTLIALAAFALLIMPGVTGRARAAEPAPFTLAFTPGTPGFALVRGGIPARLVADPKDAAVVWHALDAFAGDLAAVGGTRPELVRSADAPSGSGARVVVGTLGHSAPVDALVRAGAIDVSRLRGAWESFIIAVVPADKARGAATLLVVGSDRRGTAYGLFELSEAMGVSPWTWWADVVPAHHDSVTVPAGTRRFGPPSVKYRGLFINDEDWGLFPWAAKTFDPARGNIGPRTYEKVFQLLLRLKANTLWPAMHKVSAPFNSDPENARLADSYGIVMGSSHAEPMLRNNVGEWTGASADFNYATNPKGVSAYWEERVRSNAGYENLWTLGMRGIHDSGMVGADTLAERVHLLDTVIADQRAMLARDVPEERRAQVFMPYKEVLDIYRGGLSVPDEVTILWPDDNFGYIRQFADARERARSGGAGVYYHLSYLGAPMSYLWLYTTPPALVQEEMTRAWDKGARSVWIANAGDIKPAEIGLDLFFEMGWDIDRWRGRSQADFLADWAGRTFGAEHGAQVGSVLDRHFRLNFERRPEHLQWWLPGERPTRKNTPGLEVAGRYALTSRAVDDRLARFAQLTFDAQVAAKAMRPEQADSFFELVGYPVQAAAAANRRFFGAERYAAFIDTDPALARAAGAAARSADAEITALTRRYNEDIAQGKWRHILAVEPADDQWRDYRLEPASVPVAGLVAEKDGLAPLGAAGRNSATLDIEPETGMAPAKGWRRVEGLGHGEGSLVARAAGATLALDVTVPQGPARPLALGLLPLFPDDRADDTLRLSVRIDDGAPQALELAHPAGSAAWTQGVLDNRLWLAVPGTLSPGHHRIAITATGTGIALDTLRLQATPVPHTH